MITQIIVLIVAQKVGIYNSTVKAWGNSTVVIPNYSRNKRGNIILTENSTLKDCKTKTIYQSGNWKLVLVGESEDVE